MMEVHLINLPAEALQPDLKYVRTFVVVFSKGYPKGTCQKDISEEV